MSKWSSLLGLATLALLVSGCSGPPASETASEYAEPAWMAEKRLAYEEALATGRACLISQGFTPSYEPSSVFGIEDSPSDTDEVSQQKYAALEECGTYLSAVEEAKSPSEEYTRMLDVHYCIQAQGYPVGELQSEDVWTERFVTEDYEHLYQPLFYLNGLDEQGKISISKDEMEKLQAVCVPTSGSGRVVYWND